MIVQIRGTSGSGKSWVMRQVMDRLGPWTQIHILGRKRPLRYVNQAGDTVLGHYETPCGGCDTIGSARAVYDLIQGIEARNILCEGLLLSEDVRWSSQLPDLRVVFLNTPVDHCLRQIEGRRQEAGNDKPLCTTNTVRRVEVIQRARVKLEGLGVQCISANAGSAVKLVLKWIRG